MQDIAVRRYIDPTPLNTGYQGYVEPADKSWIAFVDFDGAPSFFLYRDSETGAVFLPGRDGGMTPLLRAEGEPVGVTMANGLARPPASPLALTVA